MDTDRNGLFSAVQMSQDFDEERPLPTAGYGLAWPPLAFFGEPGLLRLQQDEEKMTQIATRALAAQAAVGDLYLATLLRADTTLEAVDQITDPLQSTPGMSALEEFHRMQRTQFLTRLSQIASRGATLILAEMR